MPRFAHASTRYHTSPEHHHDRAAEDPHAHAREHTHARGHDHGHSHGFASGTRAFAIATLINLAYTVLEAGYGFYTDSLALLSDALHNFGDVLGLGAGLGRGDDGKTPAERPPHLRLAARDPALAAGQCAAAGRVQRRAGLGSGAPFRRPTADPGAAGDHRRGDRHRGEPGRGLVRARWPRRHSRQDLNRRGAFLHLVADAAVSLAAVLAGVGMLWLDWRWLDPATAVLVAVVVALGASRPAARRLRGGDGRGAARDRSGRSPGLPLRSQPGVTAVHHLHIWSLGAGEIALTAHLVRPEVDDHDTFIDTAVHALNDRFGINHPTLQIEHAQACDHDLHDRAPHGNAAQDGDPYAGH